MNQVYVGCKLLVSAKIGKSLGELLFGSGKLSQQFLESSVELGLELRHLVGQVRLVLLAQLVDLCLEPVDEF